MANNTSMNKGRRRFLIATGAISGTLAVGTWWFYRQRDRLSAPSNLAAAPGENIYNAWLKITRDDEVIVQVPRQEMGQGVTTALPMLVAEELDADFARVRFEQAPIDEIYANATMLGEGAPFRPDDESWLAALTRLTQFKLGQILGLQGTGGSTSVRDAWEPMRYAGATARAMLLAAAAEQFGVTTAQCRIENGVLSGTNPQQRLRFGELAAAASVAAPAEVTLKQRSQFSLLGKSQPRLDVPPKVDGSAAYGIDASPPGMIYAALAQCPILNGTVGNYDAAHVVERPGVKRVLDIAATDTSAAAVAVIAEHYWQARQALAAMDIDWLGGEVTHNTADQIARYQTLLDQGEARTYDHKGDLEAGFNASTQRVAARYYAPYLAHATMEPLNCTAWVRSAGHCEVWVGNQSPSLVAWITAKAAGVASENVTVHTPYLGGGFGRRGEMDVVMQAVMIAKALPDVPVQLIWSREQDIQHDVYRPQAAAQFDAGLDNEGRMTAFQARTVSQSCTTSFTARLLPALASDAMKDKTTTEGIFDLPYALPNRRIEHVLAHEPVQVGYWRSVGHSHNAYFAESFIDECAVAAGADPYTFRHQLLAHSPRHQTVLDLAAAKAAWGEELPPGSGRGIALAESFGSIVAQVAEVEVRAKQPRVRRVVCAIDCGFAIDPDNVIAQMHSGIIFGLSAVLYGEITIRDGRIEQSNYPDYRLVTLADTPKIEVHIVESGIEHLGGVGEPGTPPIAPAVCNAYFAATGERIRSLPIRV